MEGDEIDVANVAVEGIPKMNDATENAPDGVLAHALAIRKPSRDDPNWPLTSLDGRDWASSFCERAAEKGYPGIDEGWMVLWFEHALRRGLDEPAMRDMAETQTEARGMPKWEWR